MELLCIKCGNELDTRTANVQTNLIQCSNCYAIHRLDELMDNQNRREDNVVEPDEMPIYKESFEEDNSIFDNRDFNLMPVESHFKQPPKGSKIEIFDTRTSLEISVPPSGFQASDIFLAGFSIFWLGFVAFWTTMVLWGGVWFMALFSIPFWLVGVGMVSGIIGRLFGRQLIEIDRYTLRLTKSGVLSKKIYDFDIEDIDSIGNQKVNMANLLKSGKFNTNSTTNSSNNSFNQKQMLPTIRIGIKDVTIFESLSEPEQVWGISILKQAIQKYAEKRV
jgi:hypothetical protein